MKSLRGRPCPTCSGRGYIAIPNGAKVCDRCGGYKRLGFRTTLVRTAVSLAFKWQSLTAHMRYLLTDDCGYVCEFVGEFGWVPEAGCPVHDPETRFSWALSRLVFAFRPHILDRGDTNH